jgi:hypothetical protein
LASAPPMRLSEGHVRPVASCKLTKNLFQWHSRKYINNLQLSDS